MFFLNKLLTYFIYKCTTEIYIYFLELKLVVQYVKKIFKYIYNYIKPYIIMFLPYLINILIILKIFRKIMFFTIIQFIIILLLVLLIRLWLFDYSYVIKFNFVPGNSMGFLETFFILLFCVISFIHELYNSENIYIKIVSSILVISTLRNWIFFMSFFQFNNTFFSLQIIY